MTPELYDLLLEIREYLDNRSDCDVKGDPPEEIPNDAMRLMCRLDEALEGLE